jgi:hypothetical protein
VSFVVQTSDSYAHLNEAMGRLLAEVAGNPGFVAPDLDLRLSKPELRVEVDRARRPIWAWAWTPWRGPSRPCWADAWSRATSATPSSTT